MLIYYALEKFELYCQKKVGIHKTIREQHLINKVCENTHTQKKPKTKNQTKITMNLGSWNIFPGVQPGLSNSIWNDGGNDHISKEKKNSDILTQWISLTH